MIIKVTTNLREFTFDTDDMRTQNRGGLGVSVFGLADVKQRKNEEIISVENI